jgi:hypothetical protein
MIADWDTQQIGLWGLLIVGLGLILLSLLYRPPAGEPRGAPPGGLRCPRCGHPAPAFRLPRSWRQFLWGGATCRNCGCEFDRKGNPVGKPHEGAEDRARDKSDDVTEQGLATGGERDG